MSLTDVSSHSPASAVLARPFAALKKVSKNAWMIGVSLVIYTIVSVITLIAEGAVPQVRFDPSPILNAGTAIQIHASAAVVTLGIGIFLMFAPKGFGMHKTFGWAWVASMTVTAVSSFFITTMFENSFSPIHALSAWTMISLPFGIAAVKRRNIKQHRKTMTDMFVGGMVIAGLFTLLPGRTLWHVFFTV